MRVSEAESEPTAGEGLVEFEQAKELVPSDETANSLLWTAMCRIEPGRYKVRIPSASVGSPICLCQRETGGCEVRIAERTW